MKSYTTNREITTWSPSHVSIVDAQLISYLSVQALAAPVDVFWCLQHRCRPPGHKAVLLLPRIVFVSSSVIWASFWMLVYYLWHESKVGSISLQDPFGKHGYLSVTNASQGKQLIMATALHSILFIFEVTHSLKKLVVLIFDWYCTVNRVPNTTHN